MKKIILGVLVLICSVFADEQMFKYTGTSAQIKQLEQMIKERQSFVLTRVQDFGDIVKRLEKIIEENGMTCRIYTKKRTALIVTIPLALLHDALTFDPDYEIAKDKINHRVFVEYKN